MGAEHHVTKLEGWEKHRKDNRNNIVASKKQFLYEEVLKRAKYIHLASSVSEQGTSIITRKTITTPKWL